ncbi:MAG: ATP-binding protein, partial [bacterium]|nr:ATP-binding protein [bacterium]
ALEPSPGSDYQRSPLILSKDEVFNGLDNPGEPGKKLCNGLISDWVYWQDHEIDSPFPVFRKILELLTPKAQKKLAPGNPTTGVPGGPRRIPTVLYPYGEVPVTHTASSVQRILSFAYIMLWMWESHKIACEKTGQPTYRSMILLFDELECHLHPKWQRSIISSLLQVKEYLDRELNIQFFITTHSPLLMASLEPYFDEGTDKALLLDIKDDDIAIEEHPLLRLGPVGNWLTSDLFGLAQPRSLEAEDAILKAMALQKQAAPDKNEVATIHRLLLDSLGDVDPFWPRWLYFAEINGVEVCSR